MNVFKKSDDLFKLPWH